MTIDERWMQKTWSRVHATHGTFFVDVDADGTAGAVSVHGSPVPRYEIEHLAAADARFANVALAMMACEQRILELDRAIVDDTCADLRAYATQVA
jgi:hypothetical protein